MFCDCHSHCPQQWVAYRGSCYSFSTEKKDWNSSQESCRAQGAHLLVISDTWEMDLFKRIQAECFWIGLRNSTSSGWIWEDGSIFNDAKMLHMKMLRWIKTKLQILAYLAKWMSTEPHVEFTEMRVSGDTSPITEPQYLVLVPFLIHTDSQEKVCVQLTHLNESVTLSATLEYLGENRSLIEDVVSEKDVFTCIPFSLPKSRFPLPTMFLTVTVKGATLQFSSRKIVSLDEEFRPVNEMIPLDPKKNRLYQWTNVELEMGFIQLFFNLTSEPIQGTYTVVAQKASGKTVRHSFSVEEYVLPKFEVTVKMPQVISILDEELKVTVCGLYTFGKPVPGLVSFRVCREYEHAAVSCYGEEARAVCEEFSGQTDIYGCVSEVVKTKLFQLKRRGYKNKLSVEAKIKEEDTGVEMTGTSFSEITTTISRVTFALSDTYYKRGVPFFGQAKYLGLHLSTKSFLSQ
ncbi:hypothetical protein IHE44_0005635 [Lamprotornis superbus]|uniref:C-type lectin domain-containing protein n=1 Tax=Lamprotornis superbus TaxID=245042 RepID=A0A835NJS2_9PASS|nr:hypothetical protein IHE44_0005635 [Lamprotornis superbus]